MSKKQKEFDEKKRQLRVANYLKQVWGIKKYEEELKHKLKQEGKSNEKAWNQRRV